MQELQTILVSALVAGVVCIGGMSLFWGIFHVGGGIGVCEKYGWQLEGTGPYQHRHCYDPKTRVMYLPKEIDP